MTKSKAVNMPRQMEEKLNNDATMDAGKEQNSGDQDFISAGRNSYDSDRPPSFKGVATEFECFEMPTPAETMHAIISRLEMHESD